MNIVINIDEEVYKRTLPYKDLPVISNLANDYDEITHAVANGVPLPKGHGRLGDLDALREEVSSWGMNDYEPSDFTDEIDRTDTIIPADKEQIDNGNDD
jgi:hypothetical protein